VEKRKVSPLLRNEPRLLGRPALVRRRETKWGGNKNEKRENERKYKWKGRVLSGASEGRRDEDERGKQECEGKEMEE
jgi:hypothetical protein